MQITKEQIEKAFTEWDRRYRNDPEKFQNEVEHLLTETPDTYGKACAPYFIELLKKVEK